MSPVRLTCVYIFKSARGCSDPGLKKHCLMRFKNFLHELVRLHHPRREDRARPLLRLHQIFLTKFANWRNLKTTASFHLRNLKPRRPNCSANFDAPLGYPPSLVRLKNSVKTESNAIAMLCDPDQAEMLLRLAKDFYPDAVPQLQRAIRLT